MTSAAEEIISMNLEEFSLPTPVALQNSTKIILFPNFLAEIRLKIWRRALPGPRIVQIRHTNDGKSVEWTCLYKHLTILAVNRESREEALKHYTMVLASKGDFHLAFNPHRDTIYDTSLGLLDPRLFEAPPFQIARGVGDVTLRTIAVKEAYLLRRKEMAGVWLSFEEIVIVVCIENSWEWPLPEGCDGVRELEWGVRVTRKGGWGDEYYQNEFMRTLEKTWKASATLAGAETRRPKVKVVHSHYLNDDDEGFCVGLTLLSLRRRRRVHTKRSRR